ncbi:MAG TPA: 1-phosphofructokinase family hexose kinase [Rhizomicrobium sp.]|nr:1-phosphofructokinase family hexose kinase [Rhizomicrobium sp.]
MTDRITTLTINPALDLSTAVDELRPFSKLRCAGERRDPGGGGINVARAAKRLGAVPTAVYPAGGPIGAFLAQLVAAEGIESVVVPIAGDTREDVTVTETKSGRQFRFVLAGPRLAETEWRRCLDDFAVRLTPQTLAVASGSLPPGVPDDFYALLARTVKAAGAQLVLDCSGPPLKAALDAGVYLIKPNLRELRGLLGETLPDQASWVSAARRLIEAGHVEVVALSLAEEGALLVTRDRAWRAYAPQVAPVSSVGAGDSFLGAMVWSLARGDAPCDAFRRAVAAGTAALLAHGTELCRVGDVDALTSAVRVVET